MALSRLDVAVAPPYPVILGSGLDLGGIVADVLEPGTAAILTDTGVGPLYAESVRRTLQDAGWTVRDTIEVRAGEASKSLAAYEEVLGRLARSGLQRDGTLFLLGGGVVGDLGGFAASTFMRGIDFVALPTTLLAMVDSSVGGKVGLDLSEGKNLVGSFARPRLVVAELGWLRSLPDREISGGLAEVIKMGLLCGGEYFEDLNRLEDARTGDPDALWDLVTHSVGFKAAVVAEDELEGGRRAILNYGHTVGHGIEAAAGYAVPHGEAISAGMVAAARLSRERFGTDLVETHERLLESAGLPLRAPGLAPEAVLSAMGRDKKRRSGDGDLHRFVLLEDVGRPAWGVTVGEAEVRRALDSVLG